MFSPASPVSPPVQSPVFFEDILIPESFGLLCWNVHKENLRRGFNRLVREWERVFGLDLILLQEALFSKRVHTIAGFPYVAAANLKMAKKYAGVVTAAHADPHDSKFFMTLAREPLVFTPKNTLVTLYRFQDKAPLMAVNLHAINFRSLSWYQWELSRLQDLLRGYEGAMVLAGDFNCWQPARKLALDRFAADLGLSFISPDNGRYVKKWFGFHLDRIYVRGLIAEECLSLPCKSFSDHNPIMARFRRDSPGQTAPLQL
jgi:endonuclease/exonuclease/phosphatase (EEP) superfamily protein YafD